ncbi:uncharacterized protein PGTG_19232 [Puccinia graminis f. sp. tritici CRL 75-36-700-3]|uniref:Uncharacterized protein n=1 Tax=Puccinia graminis f. sp. tritici (strain CRL 75-36-700-3 / race SCCL) TaxID=418459 RepID=E3L9A2_PUCGT|nr:uncharacterized protein PGTG_19232 [Puccinia graminis f. sp. tritici CRL 75-36-700-3]EFP93127.2 hypothetical protein PGTG_19232 [Puccinia graminis f. sp. tritici CRL 75-36-700-3]
MDGCKQISTQPAGSGQMSISNADPGLESQQAVTETGGSSKPIARGPLSKAVLRMRGGEGHHCIAECCWSVSPFPALSNPLITPHCIPLTITPTLKIPRNRPGFV